MRARKGGACELDGDSDEVLIIALDFGTTYSGVAYCFASHRDPKPTAVMEWPGNRGISAPKIPTLISYNPNNPTDTKWGACVDKDSNAVVGIKLLLDTSQRRPAYLSAGIGRSELTSLPKLPAEVAADFIRKIYEHALLEISKTVPAGYMDLCSKKFVVTVPAVWSDGAKYATMQAATAAGIYPITMIKEPEAAALFTTQSLDFALKPSDAFVVCDAGGGTVDLISYEVEDVQPNLRVKELVPGTGGMSGSIGLNVRFAAEVQALVGELQWQSLQGTKGWTRAEKQFDHEIKRAFGGDESEEFFVTFPMSNLKDDVNRGLQSNTWRMTGTDLKRIFDPLMNDILKLISGQVEQSRRKRGGKGVTGIFLVGGFGSSLYLRDTVQIHFPDTQVLQPNDAWAAIVKGAVLSQIPNQAIVTSTSATRHYGVEALSPYNAIRDAGQPMAAGIDGTIGCPRMTWYIHAGDDLPRDQRIKFPFFREIEQNYTAKNLVFESKLYQCEDKLAPTHRSKGEKVTINCIVTADLSEVPRSYFKPQYSERYNMTYYKVHYDLVLTLKSAIMTFSLEVNGKTMGSVEVKFD